MGLTGLEIFKYLPAGAKTSKANCKECGCVTCMMFALKLAKQQITPDKCPYIDDNLANIYLNSLKHPQNTIKLGNLTIGGENVLYRHEKTFINPTTIGIVIDCAKPDWELKINEIKNFKFFHAGTEMFVDLIVLKNSNNVCLKLFNDMSQEIISYEDLQKLDIKIITEENFKDTKELLIKIRKTAILEKKDEFSMPVCVKLNNDDVYSQCSRASYYICKYANMLLFEEFDKDMISSILTLRYNIFTDPQKTLQVEPGLYSFNNPQSDSIIFLTTNFALTYFAVANELESLDIPSYLIVVPAQGMSVLTAWSAQTVTADIVMKAIEDFGIKDKLTCKKIIISGLLSELREELNQIQSYYTFIEGTKDAADIAKFVHDMCLKI